MQNKGEKIKPLKTLKTCVLVRDMLRKSRAQVAFLAAVATVRILPTLSSAHFTGDYEEIQKRKYKIFHNPQSVLLDNGIYLRGPKRAIPDGAAGVGSEWIGAKEHELDGAAGGRVWAEGGLVAGPWEEVLYTGRRAGPRERQTSRPRGGESSGPREAEAFDPRGGSSELRGAASGPCEFCSSGGLCWAGKKVGLGLSV
ncbi:hypothetical protein M9H77_02062 [Catharanthus roseus]|uniref:Uncharacterized protein n=1 Tax=Catharanthus roseus TaxID=4058 RepID=A0ACC0C7G2_CATRO|nr:hypothetical protein M9H77_02062 [Catharanthus roseus]